MSSMKRLKTGEKTQLFGLTFDRMVWENFKAYRGRHKLSFANKAGLYLIEGRNDAEPELENNGAGKSTIWDVLSWILYGKTLSDERPGSSVEPWVGDKATFAEVSFYKDGVCHCVRRRRHPNSLTIASGSVPYTEVTQEAVDELLGLSFTAFVCTIVLPQFPELFLDMKPEQQSRLFSETLSLDRYLTAAENATALMRVVQDEINEAERDITGLDGRMAELDGQEKALAEASKAWAANRAELIRGAEAAVLVAHDAVKKVQKAPRKRPVGGQKDPQPLSGVLATEIATLRALVSGSNDVYLALKTSISIAERELVALDRQAAEYLAVPDVCPTCRQKVPANHFKKRLSDCQAQIDRITKQLDKDKKGLVNAATTCGRHQRDLEDKEAARDEARRAEQDAARQVAFEAGQLEQMLKACAVAGERLKDLQNERNPHDVRREDIGQRRLKLRQQRAIAKAKLNEGEVDRASYRFWVDGFKQIRLDLIDQVLAELEDSANRQAIRLGLVGWHIEFVTEKETQSGNVSRGFSVMLYPPNVDKAISWKSYCGGERQRWQLVARFALSELLLAHAGLAPNVEILDEPTAHLSPQGISDLLTHLRERAKRLGRQIWIVDNRLLERDAFDGVYLVEKGKDGSALRHLT